MCGIMKLGLSIVFAYRKKSKEAELRRREADLLQQAAGGALPA
jgi:hypothetical protein